MDELFGSSAQSCKLKAESSKQKSDPQMDELLGSSAQSSKL
jgi:hypothetical protein